MRAGGSGGGVPDPPSLEEANWESPPSISPGPEQNVMQNNQITSPMTPKGLKQGLLQRSLFCCVQGWFSPSPFTFPPAAPRSRLALSQSTEDQMCGIQPPEHPNSIVGVQGEQRLKTVQLTLPHLPSLSEESLNQKLVSRD